MKQLFIRIGLILLIAIFIASGWYLLSPLFLNHTVDEPSPFVFPTKQDTRTAAEQVAARILTPEGTTVATRTATAIMGAVEAKPVAVPAEPVPAVSTTERLFGKTPEPTLLAQGNFVDGDSFQRGSGLVTLIAALDGTYLLRFENFWTTNGPALNVLLSPNAIPTGADTLGEYLDLGDLKGNMGDQNYTLPADFDPTLYKSVVIYCVPFRIIFASATLETP